MATNSENSETSAKIDWCPLLKDHHANPNLPLKEDPLFTALARAAEEMGNKDSSPFYFSNIERALHNLLPRSSNPYDAEKSREIIIFFLETSRRAKDGYLGAIFLETGMYFLNAPHSEWSPNLEMDLWLAHLAKEAAKEGKYSLAACAVVNLEKFGSAKWQESTSHPGQKDRNKISQEVKDLLTSIKCPRQSVAYPHIKRRRGNHFVSAIVSSGLGSIIANVTDNLHVPWQEAPCPKPRLNIDLVAIMTIRDLTTVNALA